MEPKGPRGTEYLTTKSNASVYAAGIMEHFNGNSYPQFGAVFAAKSLIHRPGAGSAGIMRCKHKTEDS